MNAAAVVTSDPLKLAALCELWRSSGREIWVTIQGQSMCPALLPGTRLKIRCGQPPAAPGDLGAYRVEGRLIVHRLLNVTEDQGARRYLFQGDANPEPDGPVLADAVLGTVVETRAPAFWSRARATLGWWRRRLADARSAPRTARR